MTRFKQFSAGEKVPITWHECQWHPRLIVRRNRSRSTAIGCGLALNLWRRGVMPPARTSHVCLPSFHLTPRNHPTQSPGSGSGRRLNGFTLVELLVVIAIIGILA